MDIKDVRVGMFVQISSNAHDYAGCVGTVSGIDYGTHQATLKLDRVNKDWSGFTSRFDEYQDPEADMIVWDALEVGEHYIDDGECVKLNNCLAHNLSRDTLVHHVSRLSKFHKVKLLQC